MKLVFYFLLFFSLLSHLNSISFWADKSKVKEKSSTLKLKYEYLDEARTTVLGTYM
jgi:hypothetical protein